MYFSWVTLMFLGLTGAKVGRVWAQQPTDSAYSGVEQGPMDNATPADGEASEAQRSTPDEDRRSREVHAEDLTIDTLPDNMTHLVIPLSVEQIISSQHPVKAGLSDAFMVVSPSLTSPGARQRTIYEYHRVQIDTAKITNHCAFEFTALPTSSHQTYYPLHTAILDYPGESQYWHKGCFSCEACKMTLNMKNYKGFDKKPYCNAHYPKTNFTCVADTPENLRLKQQSKIQSQ
ncbi:hypothetical protein NHX12_031966, partial [Muraenolepis orangiensis]